MKYLALLGYLILLAPGIVGAEPSSPYTDWAQCVLHSLPGVTDDARAETLFDQCRAQYAEPKKLSGGGCGAYNAEDCLKAHAKGNESANTLDQLRDACSKYYSPKLLPKQYP